VNLDPDQSLLDDGATERATRRRNSDFRARRAHWRDAGPTCARRRQSTGGCRRRNRRTANLGRPRPGQCPDPWDEGEDGERLLPRVQTATICSLWFRSRRSTVTATPSTVVSNGTDKFSSIIVSQPLICSTYSTGSIAPRNYRPRCRRRRHRVPKFHALQVGQGPVGNYSAIAIVKPCPQ
jgi:hypothetical protein